MNPVIPKELIECAQHINRASKLPGNCKSTTMEIRSHLAAIIMGAVGHEVAIEMAVIEALNPQADYDEDLDDDEDDY